MLQATASYRIGSSKPNHGKRTMLNEQWRWSAGLLVVVVVVVTMRKQVAAAPSDDNLNKEYKDFLSIYISKLYSLRI
jgi:hypothetical protein